MSEEFSTVDSFWSVEEAQLARIQLEMEGVHAHLDDEYFVRMAWIDANAISGVKLRVKSADGDRAREILRSESQPELTDEIFCTQSILETDPNRVVDSLNPDDDDTQVETTRGILAAMRFIKAPVIWVLYLAPQALWVLLFLSYVFSRLVEEVLDRSLFSIG